jgi:S1-C subfamily serine protease
MYTREEIMKMFYGKNEPLFHDYFLPIIGAKSQDKINNLYGTCSYIGNNFFITASHCINNISKEETGLILFKKSPESQDWQAIEIKENETFEKLDIAIINIESTPENIKAHKWANEEPIIFTEVYACGYPHGFDAMNNSITSRGLKGVVCGLSGADIFSKGNPFNVIETSFACPKGISGAPLIEWNINTVHGIIVGNTKASITTHEIREVDIKKNESSYFTVEETTSLGMTVSNQSIFKIKSELLKMTFKEYLQKENLLQ